MLKCARSVSSKASALILAALLLFSPGPASAEPSGGSIPAGGGSGTIQQGGGVTTILQQSNRLIIDWNKFGISANELVRFVQPSQLAAVLNRVTGVDPSVILGSLQANGRVFLVNPNGIFFGSTARVDVGSLMATTLNITNEDFLRGIYNFVKDPNKPNAFVINQGQIKAADGGYVILAAPLVSNEGVIIANLGRVTLAATSGQSISLDSQGLVNYVMTGSGDQAGDVMIPPEILSQVVKQAVANGDIVRGGVAVQEGNRVRLVGAEGLAINSGTIRADGPSGVVTVNGARSTALLDGSSISAMGGAGQTGGHVVVTGETVNLLGNATIDVSGAAGGGTVNVGGDYQGQGTVPMATNTLVGADALIHADATVNGNGGNVYIWGAERSFTYGTITARGGPEGGNGGFVETSGHHALAVTRTPDVTSPKGNGGNWLLDPDSLVVSSADYNQYWDPNVAYGSPLDAYRGTAYLNKDLIETALNSGISVTLTTVCQAVENPLQAGDLTIAANINKVNGGNATLTLIADRNITVDGSVSSTANALNIILTAQRGYVHVSSNVNTNGGSFSATSAGEYNQSGTINTSGGNFYNTGTSYTLTGNTNTGGGSFTSLGSAYNQTGNITSGGGDVLIGTQANPRNGAVSLGGNINAGSGNIQISTDNGATNQASGTTLIANGLRLLNVNGGDFTLMQVGNDLGTVSANTSSEVHLRDFNSLTVGTVNTINGTTAGITTNNRLVEIRTDGTLTVANDINVGTNTVNLRATSGSIISSGAGSVVGAVVNLRADNGSVGTGTSGRLNTDAGTLNVNDGSSGAGVAGNVYINELNDIILGNLRAPGTIDVLAGGTITVQGNPDSQLLANTIALRSTGGNIVGPGTPVADTLSTIADVGSVGAAGNPLLTQVNTLLSASANGAGQGVYITNNKDLSVISATATGTGGTVQLTTTSGSLTLGNGAIVTDAATGTVNLTAANAISDSTATSIYGNSLTASAGTGSVGTSSNPLNTMLNVLTLVSANSDNQGVYLTNGQSLTVNAVTATGANGTVRLTTTAGSLNLANTAITTPGTTGSVVLNAADSISDGAAVSITANTLSATAGTGSIGANGNALNTMINTLVAASANSDNQGVYLSNGQSLSVTSATSNGANGTVQLTTTAGGLTLADNAVQTSATTGTVQLTAATGITDGTATSITGNNLTASATTGSVGSLANPLNTLVNTLVSISANANGQGVFISNGRSLAVTSVTAAGTSGTVNLATTAGDMTLANGAVVTPVGSGSITLTAAANLLDNNLVSVTGNTLTASAGTGSIGTNANPLNTSVTTLVSGAANGANQSVHLTNDRDLAVTSATATGTNGLVQLTTTAGSMTLADNAIVTPTDTGTVTLNSAVNITDGSAVSITGNLLTATAVTGRIGDAGSPLDTRVHVLDGSAQGLINLNNTGSLTVNRLYSTLGTVTLVNDDSITVTAPTAAGNPTVNGTVVTITENGTATGGITVNGPSGTATNPTILGLNSVTLTNNSTGAGSGISILGVSAPATSTATVSAPTVNVSTTGVAGTPHTITLGDHAINASAANLSARGSIVDGTGVSVTAGTGTFTADTGSVGVNALNPLNTTLNTLVASANSADQGVYLTNTQSLVVQSATATGTNGRVELTTTAGGLTLLDGAIVTPATSGTVILTAATGIADGTLTSITGNNLTATAGTGSVGNAANALNTMVNTLVSGAANTDNQGVYLSNGQSLAVTSATATGANGTVQLATTAGDLTLANNAVVTPGNTGSVRLTAAGSLNDGTSTSVTGNTLTASAGTGSIGTSNNPLNTLVNTLVSGTANSASQGVYLSNGQSLAVTSATATGANGTVQLATTVGGLTLGNGSIVTSATSGTVLLTAATSIVDGNLTSITGNNLTASAGTGSVGTLANPLNTLVNTLVSATANADNQGVYLTNGQELAVTSATATGANGTVQLTTTAGGLTLGNNAIVTPGDTGTVQLVAATNIIDGGLPSVTANTLTAGTVLGSIGAGNSPLDTAVHHLFANADADNQRVNVNNTGTLTLDSVSAIGNGGAVVITNNAALNAAQVTAGNATTPGTITLTTTSGDLTLGTVTALNGTATISATSGSLVNGAGGLLTTGSANLYASGSIGTAASPLLTSIDTLNATALTGNLYLTETNGVLLDNILSANEANITATAGTLGVHNVTAGTTARLTAAAGAIDDQASMVTANAVVLNAATRIGNTTNPIQTNVNTLDATANTGIYVTEQDGVFVNSVLNQGSGLVQLVSKTGDMVLGTVTNRGGGVELHANTGSILDNGENTIIDVTANGNSILTAAGVIGTGYDPLEVDVTGSLGVAAGGVHGNTSVSITGVVRPSDTLDFLNVPPGLVLFNGRRLGGYDSHAFDSARNGFNPVLTLELLQTVNAQIFQNWYYPAYYSLLIDSPILPTDLQPVKAENLGQVDAGAARRFDDRLLQQMEQTSAGSSQAFVASAVELLVRNGWSPSQARAAAEQILKSTPGDGKEDQAARVKKLRDLLAQPAPKH